MRKRQEIRRIAASIMAAVMMVTAIPFGGTAYGNEVPRGGIVNTEDTETLTASDSNGEYKKNSDSNADAKIEMEAAKKRSRLRSFDAETIITGSGKENDPYVIKSPEDWVKVMTQGTRYNKYGNLQGYFALGENIDLSEAGEWRSSNLRGTFDGRGYEISGLKQPLFYVVTGTVKNLKVQVEIDNGEKETGAIARYTQDNARITNCAVSGNVEISACKPVGGIVGQCQGITCIENCFVDLNVANTYEDAKKNNVPLAGGLVGSVSAYNQLNIKNCIALGTVSTICGEGCGGLVGGHSIGVKISQCVALQEKVITNLESSYYVGKIFGNSYGKVNGTGNYAYDNMSGGANGTNKFNTVGLTGVVSKDTCLTKEFWEDTIGLSAESWTVEDGFLPVLKTSVIDPEKELTSGEPPIYLAKTNTVRGTVKSADETVISEATIIVKNENGTEITTNSAPDGTFTIEVPDGTYTIIVKKAGYLTVTNEEIGIPSSEDVTIVMQANPVTLGADTIVNAEFKTTDLESTMASDTIEISYTGTDALEVSDLAVSSEEKELKDYSGVIITEIETPEISDTSNTRNVKISFAKSLDLGFTNKKTAYLFYKNSLVSEITLKKTIGKVQLLKPANAKWDDTVKGKAVWDAVENASGYQVQLYKGEVLIISQPISEQSQTSYDFTSEIKETGDYTFKVKALGNETYEESLETESETYTFTEQSLQDVKLAAENALKELAVTNETTEDVVLNTVTNVCTNERIKAAWSSENGFTLESATDGADPGTDGRIQGTIILTLNKTDGASETLELEVDLKILPKFKVTFEAGSETFTGTAPTQENVTEGTVIKLPENSFTVYGKNFIVWSAGDGTLYQKDSEYTMPRGNVTFTAMWEDDVWDGTKTKKPDQDTEGYYLISTGAELAYFQDKDLGKAKLMCDINLGGYPFKAIEKVSEFDGCGHSIKGLNIVSGSLIYTGLFQILTNNNISIRNLNIENAKITYTRDKASPDIGILVGKVHSGKLSIENCFVSGVIEAGEKYKTDAGGLIGYVTDGSNVTIRSSYANARIQNAGSDSFVGGFIGLAGGTGIVTIENCYAIPDIRTGEHIGGFAGAGNGTVIRNSYAAGESLPTGIVAGDTSGLAEMGTIQNSVSIFPEMTSVNRISKGGTLSGNYGFVGTTASDKSGNILTPKPENVGKDQPYGADVSETCLKAEEFYQDTLGWDFRDVWTMPSAESGYLFPVLKEQKESMIPTLSLDMDPAVISVSLDQQQVTLYPRGSLKLTARVHSKNGASRDVKWVSSNPATVHVTDDGTVAVHKDAAAGTYKVTAVSQFDESKQADSEITVDNREHTVSITREDTKNSPNAEIGVYWSREDAEGASNTSPVASGKGTADSPITFQAKAGSEIYLKFKDLAEKDVVNKIAVTDKDGKTFEAKLCSIDPFIGHFTMPCGDAKIEVKYATDITYYQYTWFVGQDWGTWGTTATYTTTSWGNSDKVGSLKITNIINGKLFDDFVIKGISRYKGAPIDPKRVSDKASLTQNGTYYVDHSTDYPTLYVYLDGPGMISVNIEVKDDKNASYNIVRKSGNSSYYTLDKPTAKAGETITATLTPAGVQWLKDNPTENAVFTYEGGLNVVLFPPRFKQQADGSWTASLTMPACDIVTNVIFGAKKKAKIEGTDKEFTYDGNLHRIDEDVRASWGEYDISEDLRNQYEVIYSGINGTDYNSKVAPTDAGTYKCKVKISDDNTDYECDPITLTLTIKKAAMKTPDTPTAAGIGANTITLNPPTTFTDGTQIPELCGFEYRLGDGEWQDSAVFAGLLPDTDYHFYVRVKEGRNTEVSEVSGALDARTKTASEPVDPDKPNPDDPNPDKPNPDEPNPDNPTPSKPGTSSGSSDDSGDSREPASTTRSHSDGTWKKDQNGWWYELPGGRYVSGSYVTDPISGVRSEQVAWRRIDGAWWAFGGDGYLKTGWIWDAAIGKWYYVDEKRGMLTGWYLDPQDGRWYYLDLATGEMLTGWQLIPGWGYMYLNPFAEAQTWFYDEASGMWIYDTENTRRPYGSLYMNEKTPDGYFVDENGVWKEN